MAQHIDSVAGSTIPKASRAEFYRSARSGDILCCSGVADISREIERKTRSPWSHVAMVWKPVDSGVWLVLESTYEHGVSVELLDTYARGQDGDIVLARRACLTVDDVAAMRNRGLGILGEQYDWKDEVKMACSAVLRWMPMRPESREEFCSGYYQYMSHAVRGKEILTPGPWPATPEQIWLDASVAPVVALLAADALRG